MAMAGPGLMILVAGVLAWVGLGALGEKQAEAQALADRMGNPALAALLADPGGVTKAKRETAEMKKLEEDLRQTGAAVLDGWGQASREAAGEGRDWAKDPGRWKDRLIAVQSRLQKESLEKRVRLDPDFYLGLDAYRQKSPSPEEVPGLAMHLSVAERLLDRFLQARSAAEQYPTPCEFQSLSGPGTNPDDGPEAKLAGGAAQTVSAATGSERKSFRAEIRCSPEVLYAYVRLLSQDPWLFIVTDLAVTNSKQTFPLRSEIAKRFAPSEVAADAGSAETRGARLLEILAGGESVTALLHVDFVTWSLANEPKAPNAKVPPR